MPSGKQLMTPAFEPGHAGHDITAIGGIITCETCKAAHLAGAPTETHVVEMYVDDTGDSKLPTDRERKIVEHLEALRSCRVRVTVEVFR